MLRVIVNPADWHRLLMAHIQWTRALNPQGGLSKFLWFIGRQARGAAQMRTHVDTGALQTSHRVIFSPTGITQFGHAEAVVYVHPVVNPRHGLLTTEYAHIEDSRGGSHAFYGLVVEEDLGDIIDAGLNLFGRELFG